MTTVEIPTILFGILGTHNLNAYTLVTILMLIHQVLQDIYGLLPCMTGIDRYENKANFGFFIRSINAL